jgi:hypothetical protein
MKGLSRIAASIDSRVGNDISNKKPKLNLNQANFKTAT